MDVKVNLLQQRFNEIEFQNVKEKKLHTQNQEERQKQQEDKHNKRNEIDYKIQNTFLGKHSL